MLTEDAFSTSIETMPASMTGYGRSLLIHPSITPRHINMSIVFAVFLILLCQICMVSPIDMSVMSSMKRALETSLVPTGSSLR